MRFRVGSVPETPGFDPAPPWHPLREPTPWLMQLYALPVGLIAFLFFGGLWFLLTPLKNASFDSPALLAALLICIPVHELIHALVHPGAGRSAQSVLGFWPTRLLFYAHYEGELSRSRFVAILVMPLLVISAIPLAVCAGLGVSSETIAFVSTMNAFCSCGDLFGVLLLLWQIPRAARVRNQGYRTYWRDDGN